MPDAPRLALSLSPDGREAQGLVVTASGSTLAIVGTDQGEGLQLAVHSARQDANGKEAIFVCEHGAHLHAAATPAGPGAEPASRTGASAAPEAASRTAVVAVDTDNELLQLKFADNPGAATNYLAQLFAGLNVVYERDLDLTLLQGTTILRPSANPDPYASPIGTDTGVQLTEFGTFWQNNQAAVSRAFAMLLSGKSDDNFSSAGIAWVLNGNNYCTSRNANGGHYSVTQVFKFAGANAGHDVLVIAHELGHNFGAFHTHCSNATTGAGPAATNTIDTCFTGEQGCFNGTQVCPVPSTINGVGNVRGTLMAYCHLNGIGGCTSSEVFATAHRTLLTPRVVNNVANGCFSANQQSVIFANGFEVPIR
ncbi:MAG: zinc-dependent metalloprotease [Xanthomonadales bacterium]|nr:zinc-dependent metalloprotease [Xanthomonadales bacterium]